MNIAFIGLGRMGILQARLARASHDSILWGFDSSQSASIWFNNEFHTPATPSISPSLFQNLDLLWITVNDDAIEDVAKSIAKMLQPQTVVLHTSGALSSCILKKHLPYSPCASFHPLMACPLKSIDDSEALKIYDHVVHAFEGDQTAITLCSTLVSRINAIGVHIKPEQKTLYHAAAVFAANYPLTLINITSQLFQHCGFSNDLALISAQKMCQQALNSLNIAQNCSLALTGPVKRNDLNTIKAHETALADFPETLEVYNLLKIATFNMIKKS